MLFANLLYMEEAIQRTMKILYDFIIFQKNYEESNTMKVVYVPIGKYIVPVRKQIIVKLKTSE